MFNNVIVTGGKGFLGKVLVAGFDGNVISLGRTADNAIICDLSNEVPKIPFNTNIIIHNAGKAHVIPNTLAEEKEFFLVNSKGTYNLLKGIDSSGATLSQLVLISTVAVYGKENGIDINEEFPLNGDTPYALSKIEAEVLVTDWGKKNNIPVLIFRLPLIVGKNPPGNLGKMITGIKSGKYFSINNGRARRSLVLADDVVKCIPNNIGKSGIFNLTDGVHPTFKEIEKVIVNQLGVKTPKNMPKILAKILCVVGDRLIKFPFNSKIYLKMANDLTFNDHKARRELNWKPREALDFFEVT
ncbi:NAD-dependent epimerase/dehydratase family protein [Aquiflexum sp. TKW24L]|uniref:NAD-dependent epimerase/dehydratase family protein n=1 Tax=Aquiflexum sp. TKW24L TaxID=2942212 RepID=UPI0020BE33F9|nr:NAD-dependent epimerase/dehydratase family protein [Aquiflexum sp. TKW24L]MCL6260023.1 NAD-dependent epimerase/dehydratase family protein [Aquiflexum sp. TKW24L]